MADSGSTAGRTTRRGFLRSAAATVGVSSALTSFGCGTSLTGSARGRSGGLVEPGNVILFQGDSITDAGRDRKREGNANDSRAMGRGYAFLAASQLLATHAGADLKIYNRGISGNKVFQLAERWDKDCLVLEPDLVSILIGVNDIWHKLNGQYDGTVEVYERDYRALLARTRTALPTVKLVVCEPFVLRCGAVTDEWFPAFDGYRAAARKVAGEFGAVFVPFQSMFDEAIERARPEYWAGDGVHPSIAGAQLMAQTWLDIVAGA